MHRKLSVLAVRSQKEQKERMTNKKQCGKVDGGDGGAGTVLRYIFILMIRSYLLLPYFVTEILMRCEQSVECLIPFI